MSSKKKVLLIEDEEAIGELMMDYLKDDCDIDYVSKGKNGLAKAKKNDYSLVLTDNTLPDMQGLKLVEELLKVKPETKVVMMTGSEDPAIAKKAKEVGVSDFIVKDTAITFMEKIAKIIKKSK